MDEEYTPSPIRPKAGALRPGRQSLNRGKMHGLLHGLLVALGLEAQIALSFLRRPGARLPSFTAIISVLGVAVGVAAFVVVVTVFNSFEDELKQTLLGANPNLVVHDFPRSIPNAREFQEKVSQLLGPELRSMSLFEYNEALLNKETQTATVVVKAIEGTKAASSVDLTKYIEPPEALSLLNESHFPKSQQHSKTQQKPLNDKNIYPPLILGRELALRLGAAKGDTVFLSTGTFGLGGKNVYQGFTVAGILRVGLAQYDEKLAFIGFEDGVALFGKPGHAKGLEISLVDPSKAQILAKQLDGKIPYQFRPWQEIDQTLFRQIERDGQAVRLIVLIITFVAAFNIIVTLTLSVVDRSKQIATLRSIGARRANIIKIFLYIGGVLGFVGAFFGVALALVILRIFAGFELGELKAFYFVDRIPVHYDWKLMGMAFGFAVLLALLSALYPAYKATRVSPLLGLKPWS
jgi:lipoprotein-releasing system permease protein